MRLLSSDASDGRSYALNMSSFWYNSSLESVCAGVAALCDGCFEGCKSLLIVSFGINTA